MTITTTEPSIKYATGLVAETLVWDNHGCLPLRPGDEAFLPQLDRYAQAGVNVAGINVGFDGAPWQQTVHMLAHLRHWIARHPTTLTLLESPADIDGARRTSRLGIFFDIEGGCSLDGRLSMVGFYRDLGVRWMLIAYNRNNALGGGCQDEDINLTRFGRQVVDEMRRVGMTVCCSHTSYRTTMDVMTQAKAPVIFSHSNAMGVWRHARNVRDEAIRACAATGGVTGVNGLGIFLGDVPDLVTQMVAHIDYIAQLVGPEHVGIGLDYVFDPAELDDFLRNHPELYPPDSGYQAGLRMVPPESIVEVAEQLLRRGYSDSAVRGILGGNFRRVAEATWRPSAQASL
jgi:membrane dipeptidase